MPNSLEMTKNFSFLTEDPASAFQSQILDDPVINQLMIQNFLNFDQLQSIWSKMISEATDSWKT